MKFTVGYKSKNSQLSLTVTTKIYDDSITRRHIILYPTTFLFALTTLWINNYRLLIDHTFGNGSSNVDVHNHDFIWSRTNVYFALYDATKPGQCGIFCCSVTLVQVQSYYNNCVFRILQRPATPLLNVIDRSRLSTEHDFWIWNYQCCARYYIHCESKRVPP